MCPPNVYGTVVKLYGDGTDGHDSFGVEDTVLEVRATRSPCRARPPRSANPLTAAGVRPPASRSKPLGDIQKLALRTSGRYTAATRCRSAGKERHDGLRVIDAISPSVLGGTAPPARSAAARRSSRSRLQAELDCVVYVGCGSAATRWPRCCATSRAHDTSAAAGRREVGIRKRTTLVAIVEHAGRRQRRRSTRASRSPYFRDMGMNVSMMADHRAGPRRCARSRAGSRDAADSSPRTGARLAAYERAGRAQCLVARSRGTVTVTAVCRRAATSPTRSPRRRPIVQVFWG